VPSAAGGWAVPALGPGGILARVHSNEMILPSGLSQFVQSAAAQASGAGGGGPPVVINITAWDARSVMAAGPHIVAAINKATRNGSSLRQS
jgi:fatty acid-binding protein DegV